MKEEQLPSFDEDDRLNLPEDFGKNADCYDKAGRQAAELDNTGPHEKGLTTLSFFRSIGFRCDLRYSFGI